MINLGYIEIRSVSKPRVYLRKYILTRFPCRYDFMFVNRAMASKFSYREAKIVLNLMNERMKNIAVFEAYDLINKKIIKYKE